MIETGDTFPNFELPDQEGKIRTLKDLAGDSGLILYVYPKDDTPGCTVEAKDFRDRVAEFEQLGYKIAGLSKDGAESHCRFIDKYSLTFPLLTDEEGHFLEAIGAWGEKKMYGRTSVGMIRSTFVVAADSQVVKAYRNVRAKGHAERILKELQAAG